MNSGLLLTVTTEPESLRRRKDKIRANLKNGRVVPPDGDLVAHRSGLQSEKDLGNFARFFPNGLRPAELL